MFILFPCYDLQNIQKVIWFVLFLFFSREHAGQWWYTWWWAWVVFWLKMQYHLCEFHCKLSAWSHRAWFWMWKPPSCWEGREKRNRSGPSTNWHKKSLSYDKVENWLQFTCSANGLPSLSPYIPESSDSDHNDTLTLLNCVESARAIMEGRKKRRRATNWWSRGGKVSNPLFHSILVEPLKILPGLLMYVMV